VKQTFSSKIGKSNAFSSEILKIDCEGNIIKNMAQAEENRTLQQEDEYKSDTSDEEVGSNVTNVLNFSYEDK
jgi:hypothetical protein